MGAHSPRPILLKATPPASPRPLVPETVPVHAADSPKLSISRSYVIPPRPKPGRKPSSEVPPSRRKAQNREAQRAFRERKSQAVRVLEAQLAEQARHFEEQQQRMQQQIEVLQRQKGGSLPMQTAGLPPSPLSAPGPQTPQSIIAFPQLAIIPGSPTSPQPMSPAAISPLSTGTSSMPASVQSHSLGSPFGNPQTPADVVGLELLDHVLDQKLPVGKPEGETSITMRRPSRSHHSPESPKSPGVVRISPPQTSNPLELVNTTWSQPAVPLRRRQKSLETDFTSMFSRRASNAARPVALQLPLTPKDRCGFCTDQSVCICAASAAREEAGIAIDTVTLGSPLSTFSSPVGSPTASSPIAMSYSQPSPTEPSRAPEQKDGECTGNPVNCSQCKYDPMLTLFCSAISSKRSLLTVQGTYIPAQAAYKTLSRHPRFGDADLGELVDALNASGPQVEVNSIAKVLRILDTK